MFTETPAVSPSPDPLGFEQREIAKVVSGKISV